MSLILLNHLITSSEFNHWVRFDFALILSMWVCKFNLAIITRKDFDGLIVFDITLDLLLNTYCPYRKPYSKTNNINNNSNNPKNIHNIIQKMIEKRLCKLSKNEEVFSNIKAFYQNALNISNFKYSLTYRQFNNTNTKKNRKKNCIYYNLLFCKSAQTKIGKRLLELIDKYFHKDNIYYKIFNTNTIKISYCCTPNIMALINSHNKKLKNKSDKRENLCNCTSKTNCPVENKCWQNNVIYKLKFQHPKITIRFK